MSKTDLVTVKKRVAPGLLNIAGVSGVGISGGTLTVYLEVDSNTVRQAVEQVVETEAANVPVTYVVTGKFRAH
ncbi:MAG TPA: hypothetical protein VK200_06535 [Candidatus Limnocylindrales bacterium]|nr:hypothetical protein [Candidatus Limnocylindrales bacterium]